MIKLSKQLEAESRIEREMKKQAVLSTASSIVQYSILREKEKKNSSNYNNEDSDEDYDDEIVRSYEMEFPSQGIYHACNYIPLQSFSLPFHNSSVSWFLFFYDYRIPFDLSYTR